jgi:hypothetical protein
MGFMKITALLAMLTISPTTVAANFSLSDLNGLGCENLQGSRDCVTMLLAGEIEQGDAERLLGFIDATSKILSSNLKRPVRVGKIYLHSNGGNLLEAMKIGRVIRNNLMSVQVTHDSVCYSACVIAHLGGVVRIPVGPIGIHSFYSSEFVGAENFASSSKKYNDISELVTAYLREMRVPTALLDEMMKVSHKSLKILDFEEMKRFGVIGQDPVYLQAKGNIP